MRLFGSPISLLFITLCAPSYRFTVKESDAPKLVRYKLISVYVSPILAVLVGDSLVRPGLL